MHPLNFFRNFEFSLVKIVSVYQLNFYILNKNCCLLLKKKPIDTFHKNKLSRILEIHKKSNKTYWGVNMLF